MRRYSALNPIDQIPMPPDVVQTLLMTGGSSAQAMDWPNSTGGAGTAASSVGAHLVQFTGFTTAGAQFNFMANVISTHAAVPSSGTSATTGTTAGSTGNNIPVLGQRTMQVPPWSTGWSVAAYTSGIVMVEIWKK